MAKKHYGDSYSDKFEDVMQYIELRLKGSGTRIKVRDKEDLRTLFQRLDEQGKKKGAKSKFTPLFIENSISSPAARDRMGSTLGNFGSVKTLRRSHNPQEDKVRQRLRSQGRAAYRYNGGLAYKSSYKRGSRTVTNFRDASTGRFIKRNTHFTEE